MIKDLPQLLFLGRLFLILLFLTIIFFLKIYSYSIPFSLLFCLLTISAFLNLYQLKRKVDLTDSIKILLQLNLDLLWMSLFLFFSGGYRNPLIFIMLIPIIFGSLSLSKNYLIVFILESVIAFFLVCFYSKPISHMSLNNFGGLLGNIEFMGILISYVLILLFLSSFMYHLVKFKEQSEHEYANAREMLLKKEKNILITTFAATTAHRLGTPMATIAMKYEELKKIITSSKAKHALEIIKTEIFRCKEIIQSINNFNDIKKNERIYFYDFFNLFKKHYSQLPTSIRIDFNCESKKKIKIKTDEMLFYAVSHIIDNAIQNSKSFVSSFFYIEGNFFLIEISNDGKRLSKDVLLQKPKSEKEFGMGIGLYLSRIILERYNAAIKIIYKTKTNIVQVKFPINQISE